MEDATAQAQALKVLLIRHAESDGNRRGLMEGWQSTSLTSRGWRQARQLGQHLLHEQLKPDHVYCSPLERAVQTLQGMVAGFEPELAFLEAATFENQSVLLQVLRPWVSVTWQADLREYQNGVFAGLTWGEAQTQYPDLCRQLETTLDWLPIPQAETLVALRQRAERFKQLLLDQHRNGECVWVISHQGLLQQLISVILGCDRTWQISLTNAAYAEFWLDRSRWDQPNPNRWNTALWQLRHLNNCEHLHPSL